MSKIIADVIRYHALSGEAMYLKLAAVREINMDNLTARCEPMSGDGDIWCRLCPDDSTTDLIMIPAIDSLVHIDFLDRHNGVIVQYTRIAQYLLRNSYSQKSGSTLTQYTQNFLMTTQQFLDSGQVNDASSDKPLFQMNVIKSVSTLDADGNVISQQDTTATQIKMDDEGIVFNEGKNGGMVIVEKLVDRLNNLENALGEIKNKFNSHLHSSPTGGFTGTPSDNTSIPVLVTSEVTNTESSQLINDLVTH